MKSKMLMAFAVIVTAGLSLGMAKPAEARTGVGVYIGPGGVRIGVGDYPYYHRYHRYYDPGVRYYNDWQYREYLRRLEREYLRRGYRRVPTTGYPYYRYVPVNPRYPYGYPPYNPRCR